LKKWPWKMEKIGEKSISKFGLKFENFEICHENLK
jgi:hypothetical protein